MQTNSLAFRQDGLDQPPDSQYIAELIEQARLDFAERDARDSLRDQLYWQLNSIPHPASVDFEEVHMGIVPETVARVAGILDDRPHVRVVTTSLAKRALARATDVEDFANNIFWALEDDADEDTWDLGVLDLLIYGRSVDQLLYLPDVRASTAPGFPQRRSQEGDQAFHKKMEGWQLHAPLPLSWRHLPARGCYVWRDSRGIGEALLVEERRASDLLHTYSALTRLAHAIEHGTTRLSEYVYFVQYWNRRYGAYWISDGPALRGRSVGEWNVDLSAMTQGELAEVFPNIYGYVPVIETSGIISNARTSGRYQLSIFDHMIPLCLYLDQLVSQKASAVRRWAWARAVLEYAGAAAQPGLAGPISADHRPPPIPIPDPDQMLVLYPGEKIGWIVPQIPDVGSDELIQIVKAQLDLLGLSSAVFSTQALGSSGYLYNSVLNAIRSKYSPVVRHIKRAHRQRIQQLLKIIELHGEPLYIYRPGDGKEQAGEWFGLGPESLRDSYYQLDIVFEDHLPTDDATDMALAGQARAGTTPLMDDNQIREKYLRDEAPERTEKRILIQKFMQNPTVQEFIIAQAVKEAGLSLTEERDDLALPPELLARLPDALRTALGGEAAGPTGQLQGEGKVGLGAPSAIGGIPGAPAQPYIPGVTVPITPPPPTGTVNRPVGPRGGRPAGQSRRPARQPPPAVP